MSVEESQHDYQQRRPEQTDFDFLKEACRSDTRSELAHLIATARRYGIGDPELMSDFVAILKGPAQSTDSTNPLGKRTPGTGEPTGNGAWQQPGEVVSGANLLPGEASTRPGTLRHGFGVEIGPDGFPGRATATASPRGKTGTGDVA